MKLRGDYSLVATFAKPQNRSTCGALNINLGLRFRLL